jgi:hypothetical protein
MSEFSLFRTGVVDVETERRYAERGLGLSWSAQRLGTVEALCFCGGREYLSAITRSRTSGASAKLSFDDGIRFVRCGRVDTFRPRGRETRSAI